MRRESIIFCKQIFDLFVMLFFMNFSNSVTILVINSIHSTGIRAQDLLKNQINPMSHLSHHLPSCAFIIPSQVKFHFVLITSDQVPVSRKQQELQPFSTIQLRKYECRWWLVICGFKWFLLEYSARGMEELETK